MVPSDPISSPLTTGMHGIELRDPERRTFRLLAPLPAFSPLTGSMPPGTPLAYSLSGPGYSWRPFARPQRLPPLGDLHSGVNVPDLPLRTLPEWLWRPFGLSAPLPCSRFAPVTAASMPQARCTSTFRFSRPLPPSPLPLRTFASFRIKAFNDVCCPLVRLANPPDLPSLPATRLFQVGFGSSFQARYVSTGWLFLKPLGTFFTMLLMPPSVNGIRACFHPFSSAFIFLRFQ